MAPLPAPVHRTSRENIVKPILRKSNHLLHLIIRLTSRRIDFLATLPDRLRAIPWDASLSSDLKAYINSIQTSSQLFTVALTAEDNVDVKATNLWNIATEIKRGDVLESSQLRVLALTRGFAFLLLDAAVTQATLPRRDEKTALRLLRVACKATRFCIEQGQLDLCANILQRAADHEHVLESGVDGELEHERHRVRTEYLGLRTLLVGSID